MTGFWPDEQGSATPSPFAGVFDDPGGVLADPYGLVEYGSPDGYLLIARHPWYEDLQMSGMDLLRQRDPAEAERIERLAARRAAEAGLPWIVLDDLLD